MCVRDIDFNFVSAFFQFHFAFCSDSGIFYPSFFTVGNLFIFSQKLDYFDLFGLFYYLKIYFGYFEIVTSYTI